MNKLIGRKVKLVLKAKAMCYRGVTRDAHSIGDVVTIMRIDDVLPPFTVVCHSRVEGADGVVVRQRRTIDRYAPIQLRYLNNRRVKV